MERIEARHRLPLNPRELRSRISALTSRARWPRHSDIQSPEHTKEIIPTSYDGVLSATREELRSVIFTVPENRPYDPDRPIAIGIASDNQRKIDEMINLLTNHHAEIHRIPEAQEEHTLHTISDATSKAVDAARIIRESEEESRRDIRNRDHVTIANDVLNAVPIVATDDVTGEKKITFQRLGKPGNRKLSDGSELTHEEQLESVRQTFRGMAHAAFENGWERVPYLAEIATVIHNPQDPDNNAVSTQRTAIFLNPHGLNYLATIEGFQLYCEKVAELGLRTKGKAFDVTNIAGGLELKVLQEMGLVMYISGTDAEVDRESAAFAWQTPDRREQATDHAYRIALGHADERLITAYFTPNPKRE